MTTDKDNHAAAPCSAAFTGGELITDAPTRKQYYALLALAFAVAEMYADTDAPLGLQARAAIGRKES